MDNNKEGHFSLMEDEEYIRQTAEAYAKIRGKQQVINNNAANKYINEKPSFISAIAQRVVALSAYLIVLAILLIILCAVFYGIDEFSDEVIMVLSSQSIIYILYCGAAIGGLSSILILFDNKDATNYVGYIIVCSVGLFCSSVCIGFGDPSVALLFLFDCVLCAAGIARKFSELLLRNKMHEKKIYELGEFAARKSAEVNKLKREMGINIDGE